MIDSFCCVTLLHCAASQFILGEIITRASYPTLIITFCALKSFFASCMELGLTPNLINLSLDSCGFSWLLIVFST